MWALVVLLAAVAGLGWADSWEAIRTAATGIDTVQSTFTQEKHLRILARPLISKGRLVYRRPGALRWEYQSPIPSILLMTDDALRRYQQIDGRWVEDRAGAVSAMPAVVGEISCWLSGEFEGNPYFDAALADGRIVLTPKVPAMSRIIQRIELQPGQRPGVITAVTIHESADAFTRITFDAPLINAPVPDTLFTEMP